jgi:1A family penicillin-binding protein
MARTNLSFVGKQKSRSRTSPLQSFLIILGKPFFVTLFFALSILNNLFLLLQKTAKKKRKKKVAVKNSRRQIIHIALGLSLFVIAIAIAAMWQLSVIVKDIPEMNIQKIQNPKASIKIYDRNNTLLYTVYKDENRTPVSFDQVPVVVRQATLAAEDAQFYSHPGFSFRGMLRALVLYIRDGTVTGGSTITQQLAKNVYLNSERTAVRKIKEIILALQIERSFTKDQILSMYLNQVSYGGVTYGIEAASQLYFGKKINEVTLPEAAFLAGLPKSPSRFSPIIAKTDTGLERKDQVLLRMKDEQFITQAEYEKAKGDKLGFIEEDNKRAAPHFVEYVKAKLAERYGDLLDEGGLIVKTTLDLPTQEMAQEVVSTEVDKLVRERVSNGSAVIITPKTGEIVAMVGSRGFDTTKTDGYVNVATSLRQPGSSIKLITYAYGLSHGLTPASLIDDSPITFYPKGGKPYTPKNYDDKYRGQISIRSAFAESRNIPAVKIMAQYGVSSIISLGKQMGITSWKNPNNYGLSLTLGGGEITLLELSEVYATVANMGTHVETTPFISIKNRYGRELYTKLSEPRQVLDPRVAYQLIDILKDNYARSPSFGLHSALVIDKHPEVAVKTGTSNNLRDNLAVGMTPDILVATWVGNNDGKPMSKIASGVTGASPIWNKIISKVLEKSAVAQWTIPTNLVQKQSCDGKRMEWYLAEQVLVCREKEKDIAGNSKPTG